MLWNGIVLGELLKEIIQFEKFLINKDIVAIKSEIFQFKLNRKTTDLNWCSQQGSTNTNKASDIFNTVPFLKKWEYVNHKVKSKSISCWKVKPFDLSKSSCLFTLMPLLWNGMLWHSFRRAVIFVSLQHFIAPALD